MKLFIKDKQIYFTIEISIFKYVFKIYNYNIIIINYYSSFENDKCKFSYERFKGYKYFIGKILTNKKTINTFDKEGNKTELPINPWRIERIKFNKSLTLQELTED